MYRYLIIDGMVSGTGVRNKYEGGYVEMKSLGISVELIDKLTKWHESYKKEFYNGYSDKIKIQQLDEAGIKLSNEVSKEIENCKVSYFSDADLKTKKI